MKEGRLNGLALLMVHRSISISIKEISDVLLASIQQRRMKLPFILDDATETDEY